MTRLGENARLAWTIAFASIALWAATAQVGVGSLVRQEANLTTSTPSADTAGVGVGVRDTPEPLVPTATTAVDPTPTTTAVVEATPTIIEATTYDTTPTVTRPNPVAPSAAPSLVPTTTADTFSEMVATPTATGTSLLASVQPGRPPSTPTPTRERLPTPTSQISAQHTPVTRGSGDEATFRLCGSADPQAERAIEQLVAGRNFRARLTSRPDGCADLTISVSTQPASGSLAGRQSTSMNVSAGSTTGAPARSISVHIVTENGVTRATIGASR